MTLVKVCGLRSLEEGRAALLAGANLLGFVFYPPSKRRVDVADAAHIIAAVRQKFGAAAPAMGALAYGIASEFVGLQIPVLVGATLCAVVWLRTWRRLRQMTPILEGAGPG